MEGGCLPDENMAAPSTVRSKPKKLKQIIEKSQKRATQEQSVQDVDVIVPHCSIPLRSEKILIFTFCTTKIIDITTVFFSNYQ